MFYRPTEESTFRHGSKNSIVSNKRWSSWDKYDTCEVQLRTNGGHTRAGTSEHAHTDADTTVPSPSAPWTPGQFLLREMRSFPIDELELDWFNSSVL